MNPYSFIILFLKYFLFINQLLTLCAVLEVIILKTSVRESNAIYAEGYSVSHKEALPKCSDSEEGY